MKSFGKIADKAVFVVSLILLVMLGAFTTLYSDDFVYGTYLLDGPAGFIRKNAEHYQNVNGRAFIHLVLEGILYWKDTLFRFVLPLMILIFGEVFYRVCAKGAKNRNRTGFLALYLCGIMLLPLAVMREGILWMSGAVNYILPTIFVLIEFDIIINAVENDKVKAVYYPAAFLCGATTEQGGAAALCVSVLWVVYCIFRKIKINKRIYLLVILTLIGYLSVILSPATFVRMTDETSAAAVNMSAGVESFCKMLIKESGTFWIFALSGFVCASICARRSLTVFFADIIGLIAAAVLNFSGHYTAVLLILSIIILHGSVFILYKNICPEEAVLMISAMASVLMLLFSTTYGARNFLPFCLIMICVCAFEVCNFMMNLEEKVHLILMLAVFVFSFVCFAPTFSGYRSNRRIIDDNLRRIYAEKGDCEYNMDIDRKYSYTQFYEYDKYTYGFKRIYNIENKKVFLSGADFRNLSVKGNRCENPVYIKDGTEYYPLRDIVESNGGKIEWDNDKRIAVVSLEDVRFSYDAVMKKFVKNGKSLDSEEYKLNEEDRYGRFFISHVYMTKEHLEELLEHKAALN